jgi:hypothetical protein
VQKPFGAYKNTEEIYGSIKSREGLDLLRENWLLKNYFFLCSFIRQFMLDIGDRVYCFRSKVSLSNSRRTDGRKKCGIGAV